MSKNLRILFVSSEVDPFVKTGGLADVAGSLPQEISKLGHDVRVVLPEYTRQIPDHYLEGLQHITEFQTRVVWRREYVGINRLINEGVPTYFVDNKFFFNRPSLYENDDRPVQFTYFCRAVLEMLPRIDFKPDVIHFNDWQTGPMALLLDDNYRQFDFYRDIKTVFTIHNLRYQGQFGPEIINDVLGISDFHWYSGNIRHAGLVNFMKMGIMYADQLNTVSPTYAEEIKDPYFGEGLDYALRLRGDDLSGIVNGLSYEKFNPVTDDRIFFNYSADRLEGKYKNKEHLQRELGLPVAEAPIIGVISRLVEQKGLDLITHVFEDIVAGDLQFVLLGTGNTYYESFFRQMADTYPEQVAACIKYDAGLAQKIYAGSDIFLMPSRYEPCGLSQLISMRYGTIPLVKETGGLKDTVKPYCENTDTGYGFTFSRYNAHDMLVALERACRIYRKRDKWRKLIKRVMQLDYSWERSAREYIDLYCN
ncbi:MAG: glycogen synthase GlgA [Bacillota bacterium]